jgi:hypothetical protein
MVDVVTVGIAAGVPVSGTGNVPSLAGVFDRTAGPAIIKAGNTQAAAADNALVTTLSPNSFGLNVNGIAVTASSSPVVVASNQPTLSVAQDITQLANGVTGTNILVKKAIVQLSATGSIVAGVGGKKLRVFGGWLSANGTVNVKWQSHVTPTDLSGLLYLVANTGYVLPFNPFGWFLDTLIGEALDLNLSAGIAVGGTIFYGEV